MRSCITTATCSDPTGNKEGERRVSTRRSVSQKSLSDVPAGRNPSLASQWWEIRFLLADPSFLRDNEVFATSIPDYVCRMKIRKTLGIDLGTTNSVLALLDPTDSSIITAQDEQGHRSFPSVVAYHSQQDREIVGHQARHLADPKNPTINSIKRFMGVDHELTLGEEKVTPAHVSAHVLRHCCEQMARTLNNPQQLLDHAIITMPAYFNHNQIEDTRRAGELAGLKVVELLHEPTAAAIFYAWKLNHSDATYLVYDLGGGTFDVSIIRGRHGDYEVLGVSGDPFLGGDDFDRLLASHLQEQMQNEHGIEINFDLSTPKGQAHFTTLTRLAELGKMALSQEVEARLVLPNGNVPGEIRNEQGGKVSLDVTVSRSTFHDLIRDKISRTIDCCHEALARAKEKAGIKLSDIDYVILVGGSTRVPLVRETIRAALCNPELPAHVRHSDPLLEDPDLCVAYGAALRGATHGTRYLFSVARSEQSLLPDLDLDLGTSPTQENLELHWTSPVNVRETNYTLTGVIRGAGTSEVCYGGSLLVRCFSSGLTHETFFDEQGRFELELDLEPETDNAMEVTVCDNLGQSLVRIPACIRHRAEGEGSLGLGVLPTQLITKPLSIEVLDRERRRIRQILAPVGAALPGTFHCTCRTVDQAGRIVVPIFEENRVIKQMVIDELDRGLPVGTPVDVRFQIDVKHNIEVSVQVREANRTETALLTGPPSPECPTQREVEAVKEEIEERLESFAGGYRSRIKGQMERLIQDLYEALYYEDSPKAIQRMAELRGILQQLEEDRDRQQLEPPWTLFEQFVERALDLAEIVAERTERNLASLMQPIHSHRHFGEQAFAEKNATMYQECWGSLRRYVSSLEDLLKAAEPSQTDIEIDPEEEARYEVERFRHLLSATWKQAQSLGREDLDGELRKIAEQGQGLNARVKDDPHSAIREARRLTTELGKIEERLRQRPKPPHQDDAGLLSINDN